MNSCELRGALPFPAPSTVSIRRLVKHRARNGGGEGGGRREKERGICTSLCTILCDPTFRVTSRYLRLLASIFARVLAMHDQNEDAPVLLGRRRRRHRGFVKLGKPSVVGIFTATFTAVRFAKVSLPCRCKKRRGPRRTVPSVFHETTRGERNWRPGPRA